MGIFENFRVQSATDFDTIFDHLQPFWIRDALHNTLFDRQDKLLTIVCEDNYLDVDYSSSFFLQQGRSFTPLSRRTTRVHLFSSKFSQRQMENASAKTIRALGKSYLGYVVLRPIQPPTIGRTFIKPPKNIEDTRAFFPCKTKTKVNMCGIPLEIEACPYISQDKLVMACATASLWMASSSLATKSGLPIFTTSEITALALSLERPYGPVIGSRGLRLDEEERALTMMGYDPQLWQYPTSDHLVESCYVHVESGIPVILNVVFPRQTIDGIIIEGLHAVTVVGHLMDTKHRRNAPFSQNMYCTSEFVPSFITNDDQNGLYLRADVTKAPRSRAPYRAKLVFYRGTSAIFGFCHSIMVPFPPRVWLSGSFAMRSAAYWLNYFIEKDYIPGRPLVLRPFLTRSNNYKGNCLRQRYILPRSADRFLTVYRSLSLPRYMWVIQYGYLDDWIGCDCDNLLIQGEFLFDASLAPAVKLDWLSMHLQGGMLSRRIRQDRFETEIVALPDDSPYVCFMRSDDPTN